MTTKDQVRQLLDDLPENCTLADVQYRLHVLARIQEGESDLDNGRVISHEALRERMAKWLDD